MKNIINYFPEFRVFFSPHFVPIHVVHQHKPTATDKRVHWLSLMYCKMYNLKFILLQRLSKYD